LDGPLGSIESLVAGFDKLHLAFMIGEEFYYVLGGLIVHHI
jgi:hypothetical protein